MSKIKDKDKGYAKKRLTDLDPSIFPKEPKKKIKKVVKRPRGSLSNT